MGACPRTTATSRPGDQRVARGVVGGEARAFFEVLRGLLLGRRGLGSCSSSATSRARASPCFSGDLLAAGDSSGAAAVTLEARLVRPRPVVSATTFSEVSTAPASVLLHFAGRGLLGGDGCRGRGAPASDWTRRPRDLGFVDGVGRLRHGLSSRGVRAVRIQTNVERGRFDGRGRTRAGTIATARGKGTHRLLG